MGKKKKSQQRREKTKAPCPEQEGRRKEKRKRAEEKTVRKKGGGGGKGDTGVKSGDSKKKFGAFQIRTKFGKKETMGGGWGAQKGKLEGANKKKNQRVQGGGGG